MTINNSGNVGIGTTSPAFKADINGSLSEDGNENVMRIAASDTTNAGGITINSVYGNTAASRITSIYSIDGQNQPSPLVLGNGTATAIYIKENGNVGIGTTSPTFFFTAIGDATSDQATINMTHTSYAGSALKIGTVRAANSAFNLLYLATGTAAGGTGGTAQFVVRGDGKINAGSGNADNYARVNISSPWSDWSLRIDSGRSSGYAIKFYHETTNTTVGDIRTTSNTTSYNESSDYRLKENVVPMTGSIDRLKELNPSRFNFITDPDLIVDGFLAHEAQEIVPECVTGTKDGMMTEEYEVSPALGEVYTPAIEEVTTERQVTETVETGSYVNLAGETITETQEQGVTEEVTTTVIERQEIDGVTTEVEVEKVTQEPVMETVVTTEAVAEVILETDVEKPENGTWRETTEQVMAEREVPDMQGIDQGKLVPLLVAALQEAIARIEVLEA